MAVGEAPLEVAGYTLPETAVLATCGGLAATTLMLLVLWLRQWRGRVRERRRADAAEARYEEKMEQFRRYARDRPVNLYEYVDAVVLGPRWSGKTSIVELWRSALFDRTTVKADSNWVNYNINLHRFKSESRKDPLFDVSRSTSRTLIARVRVYPGEEDHRIEAVRYLGGLSAPAVLLFVMRVGYGDGEIQEATENAEYYSFAFVSEVRDHLRSLAASVAKVIVVFNKADLLPPDWDREEATRQLKDANAGAVSLIEQTFGGIGGKVEYRLVSALTNYGIIDLMGSVGKAVLQVSQDDRDGLDASLRGIKGKLRARGL